jgi:hypothetical protein
MVEADIVDWLSERPERVDIRVADGAEIAEVDAELEGGMRRTHEVGFVQPKPFDERADMRQRGLTDADDTDLRRLDEVDRAGGRQQLDQSRRGHPAGSAAANDHDAYTFDALHDPLSPC